MSNVKFPRVRIDGAKIKQARLDGFMLGIWTAAYIFSDKYDVGEDDIRNFIQESADLMAAFGEDKYNFKDMFQELEEITGIRYGGFEG